MPAPMVTAASATAIELNAPTMIIDNTSRPKWSVPSGCGADGGSSLLPISIAATSWGVQASDRNATAAIISTRNDPTLSLVNCFQFSQLLLALADFGSALAKASPQVVLLVLIGRPFGLLLLKLAHDLPPTSLNQFQPTKERVVEITSDGEVKSFPTPDRR